MKTFIVGGLYSFSSSQAVSLSSHKTNNRNFIWLECNKEIIVMVLDENFSVCGSPIGFFEYIRVLHKNNFYELNLIMEQSMEECQWKLLSGG